MTLFRPPDPTVCPECRYSNGGRFVVCPCCKTDLRPHKGDCVVMIGAIGISIAISAYSILTEIAR